jgi:hypothetical protein
MLKGEGLVIVSLNDLEVSISVFQQKLMNGKSSGRKRIMTLTATIKRLGWC